MEGKTSRSGSKSNLNESTLPLLEDKAAIELKDQAKTEEANGDGAPIVEGTAAPKGKSFKSVIPRVRSPGAVAANFTVGLNVHDRDERKINEQVNILFEDVIAEPDPTHNFEFVWRLTYLFFNFARFWLYRFAAAILALPLALLWAVLFAAVNVFVVWGATPALRIFDIILWHVHRVWSGLIRTLLDPLFASIGLAFGRSQPLLPVYQRSVNPVQVA